MAIFVPKICYHGNKVCSKYISMTSLNCITLKTPYLVQESRHYLFSKPSYSYFCAIFVTTATRVGQKWISIWPLDSATSISIQSWDILVIRSRFIWLSTSLLCKPLQNRKSLARQINNLFPVSSIFRREILKMAQKHRNLAAAHAHKVLPFSATNELGLGNYMRYPCTKFGDNRWKTAPAIVQKNFVRPEVGRHARALHKSILAVNGMDSA